MHYELAIIVITFLSKLFIYSYAENISDEKFYGILEEAKVLYKGIDQGRDCVWIITTQVVNILICETKNINLVIKLFIH